MFIFEMDCLQFLYVRITGTLKWILFFNILIYLLKEFQN